MMLFIYGPGIIVLLVLWLLYYIWAGTWDIRKLFESTARNLSVSKLQFFLWIIIFIYSYITIFAARGWEFTDKIPANLLIAIGLSTTTAIVAKAIDMASGRTINVEVKDKKIDIDQKADHQNNIRAPDISEIQIMAWTSIAIGIYLIRLVQAVSTPKPELPDIDATLMVLMGLSHGAYLGNKLITKNMPIITGLSKGSGRPGTEITIYGQLFGEKQNGSRIIIDNYTLNNVISKKDWSDKQITLRIPDKYPTERDWSATGERINIGVIINGQKSANTWPFTVNPPLELKVKVNVSPATVASGSTSNVNVFVTDSFNKPVSGASIIVSSSEGSLKTERGVTDVNGNFKTVYTTPKVTAATEYKISADASKQGYTDSGSNTITVNPSSDTQVIDESDNGPVPWTPRSLQTLKLVMISLGVRNLQGIEEGNYLRWQFDSALGFPPRGFSLYRRPHHPGDLITIPVEIGSNGTINLKEIYRKLSLKVRLDGGPGQVRGLFGSNTMVEKPTGGVAGNEVNISLEADAIDQVTLPAGSVFLEAKGVPVSQDQNIIWDDSLNKGLRICLPIKDGAYPCSHGKPDDWAEAAARLGRRITPGGPIILPPEIEYQYGGRKFQDLRDILLSIAATGPQSPNLSSPEGAESKIEINPYELVLLAAIDPNIARILGLLWVDRNELDKPYDYLIVGYWLWNTLKNSLNRGEEWDLGSGWTIKVEEQQDSTNSASLLLSKNGVETRLNLSAGEKYESHIREYNNEYIFSLKLIKILAEFPALHEFKLDHGESDFIVELEVSFTHIYGWICYNVGTAASALPAPTGLKAYSLFGITQTKSDDSIIDHRFLAGLSWDLPSVIGGYLSANMPVSYHVQRQTPMGSIEWLTEKSPAIIDFKGLGKKPIWSQGLIYYTDIAPNRGTYQYRIAAVDIFGRVSQYTDWVQVELKPPLPPSPSDVEAKLLDPDDPMLTGDEKAWVKANNKPGLKVRWKWIESLRRQAPDVNAFKIHFQPGWLNVVQGKIDDIPVENGGMLELKSNYVDGAIPENIFASEKLQMNQISYNIESSKRDSDGKFIFSIKKPIPKTDDFATIDEGTFMITNIAEAGNDLKITINYQMPAQAAIESFIGRIIKINQREYKIVSCVKDSTGIYPIFTVSKIYPHKGDFFSIPLSKQSTAFINYRNASNWKQELYTEPLTSPAKEQYERIIPDPPLHPDISNMVVYGQIGIGSLNSEGEGSVSSPATIIAIYREKPPKQEIQDSPNMYATPANFYGKSSYVLRWGKGSVMYFVYRVMDETLFVMDAELRQGTRSRNPNDYSEYLSNFDSVYLDEIKNKIISPSSIDYKALTADARKNVLLKALASLPGNEKAFAKLHEKAIHPDDPKYANRNTEAPSPGQPEPAVDPSLLLYVDDTLDGHGNNCYFYRIRTVNEIGTLGDFGLSTPPVYLPKVTPLVAPKITKIEGGDRQITIKWSPGSEPGIVGYLVYRTDSERLAQDVRRMMLIKNNPADSYSVSGDKTEFVDESVEARKMYFYRAVAVSVINENGKQFENRSEPSIVVTGQAYQALPAPPIWNLPVRGATSVLLSWTHPTDQNLTCLVERRNPDGLLWTSASGWLPRGTYTFEDKPPDLDVTWEYRLRVRDYLGQVANKMPTVTLHT